MDPYFVSILIGGVRFFMSIVNTYMLKTFCRRTLIIYGSAAMAVCMFVSGLYTHWIKEGSYLDASGAKVKSLQSIHCQLVASDLWVASLLLTLKRIVVVLRN